MILQSTFLLEKQFENVFVDFNKSIVFFYSLDQLDISSRNFQISSNNQYRNYSSCSKIDRNTYLLIITNRFFSFVIKIVSIIESEIQSIFRQNFQYWQSHINTWIILDFWKFLKITSDCLLNWFESSSSVMKLITFWNSNLESIFQILHIFVQYFDKKSILKLFVFFEIIAKSYLFH